jgi:4-amino-4-deoxy-L-arabinose transferase-like glycosyltransferase
MIRRCLPWLATHRAWLAVALILGTALALMWQPMHDETATTDETAFLGAGYSYWQGHRYYLNVEHPPLMQLWSGLPLMFLNVKLPADAESTFGDTNPVVSSAMTEDWDFRMGTNAETLAAPERFYHYPALETGLYGRVLVYGGTNDADKLLFWGRFMQALVMLATGLVVFWWTKSLSNTTGGLFALAAWSFNPVALAYGHLIITDPGIALMMALAVWMFSRFLESPRPQTALIAGIAFGGALLTKYTAIILLPMFGALLLFAWWKHWRSVRADSSRNPFANLCLVAVAAWATVVLFYIPHWSPPPPISIEDAQHLYIPAWFVGLRRLLVPRDFFKGFTIMLLHVVNGHHAYLLGEWSDKGWWYYYPVAILVKTPVALLLLLISAVAMAIWRIRQSTVAEAAPLIAAAAYLACAMTSKANIGIRHVLPMYPLLVVVAGVECARARVRDQFVGWLLVAWLLVAALVAHPDYIAYFNEVVGGPANGQDYLIDSNFDWGQNGKAIQQWMEANHVARVYLDYFGTGAAIRYLGTPVDFVKPNQVPKLRDGYLVISATRLMTPEHQWLRENHRPLARIRNTLFVYALPSSSNLTPAK